MTLSLVHYMCHYDYSSGVTVDYACRMKLSCFLHSGPQKKKWCVIPDKNIHEQGDCELSYQFTDYLSNFMIQNWKCSRLFEGTLPVLNAWKAMKWYCVSSCVLAVEQKAYLSWETHFNIRSKCGVAFKVNTRHALKERDHQQKINSNNNKAD